MELGLSTRRETERDGQLDAEVRNPASDFVYSATVRRRATIAVAANVIVFTTLGIFFVAGQHAVLIAWWAAGAPLVPSLVALRMTVGRTTGSMREFWRYWMVGSAFACLTGWGIFLAGAVPSVLDVTIGVAVVHASALLASTFWMMALTKQLRATSGQRAVVIDMLDAFIVFMAVSAPGILVVLRRVSSSPDAWFIVPCTVAACLLMASLLPASLIYFRMPREERFVPGMFIILTCCSIVNSWLLVAMGLSGFTMNAGPLLLVQSVNMGLMFLMPLLSRHDSSVGLGRLTAQAQVRRPGLGLALLLAAVPLMVVEALVLPEARDWVVPLAVGALGLFVCLIAARYVLVLCETQRLYRDLEHLAEERHRLLSSLVRAAEGDSHRVAVQLHEVALSTLVMVGAVAGRSTTSADGAMDLALSKVRDDLSLRVESLRRLMLAVHTPDQDEESLATALKVWSHDLIGERATEVLTIDVDPELVLDWTTRTIVYRIAQEAIRHAWSQGAAAKIEVRVRWQHPALVVEILDNGRAPDTGSVMYGTAIDTMGLFANLGHGTVEVERSDGQTRVIARLGFIDELPAVTAAPPSRSALHLVTEYD